MHANLEDDTVRRVVPMTAPGNPTTFARLPEGAERYRLTPRQKEVLRLVAEGFTDREVADALHIETRTATTHMTDILDKLGVNRRAAAVANAIRGGLI